MKKLRVIGICLMLVLLIPIVSCNLPAQMSTPQTTPSPNLSSLDLGSMLPSSVGIIVNLAVDSSVDSSVAHLGELCTNLNGGDFTPNFNTMGDPTHPDYQCSGIQFNGHTFSSSYTCGKEAVSVQGTFSEDWKQITSITYSCPSSTYQYVNFNVKFTATNIPFTGDFTYEIRGSEVKDHITDFSSSVFSSALENANLPIDFSDWAWDSNTVLFIGFVPK